MKNILLLCTVFFCMTFCPLLHAQWVDKMTLYFPNRILDLMDTFTLNIGGGPTAHAELYATHSCKAGGGITYTWRLMKDFNRQYGYAAQNGWGLYFPEFISEDLERRPASSLVKEFWQHSDGEMPSPSNPVFDPVEGARDYWEIGGSLGAAIIDVDVSIHPVELLDAVLGFFFIDIRNDDLTFENFK